MGLSSSGIILFLSSKTSTSCPGDAGNPRLPAGPWPVLDVVGVFPDAWWTFMPCCEEWLLTTFPVSISANGSFPDRRWLPAIPSSAPILPSAGTNPELYWSSSPVEITCLPLFSCLRLLPSLFSWKHSFINHLNKNSHLRLCFWGSQGSAPDQAPLLFSFQLEPGSPSNFQSLLGDGGSC